MSAGKTTTGPSGHFVFEDLRRAEYDFVAIATTEDLFLVTEFSRDLRTEAGARNEFRFPLKTYRSEVLGTAYFDSGISEIDGETRRAIERLGEAANGPVLILWVGHADEKGSAESNYNLGLARAREVARAGRLSSTLATVRHFILSRRESEPADTRTTPDALARNRRVEVTALFSVFEEPRGGDDALLSVSFVR